MENGNALPPVPSAGTASPAGQGSPSLYASDGLFHQFQMNAGENSFVAESIVADSPYWEDVPRSFPDGMRKNARTFVQIFCRRPFTVRKARGERPRNGTVLLPFFFARCSSSAPPNFCSNLLTGGRPSSIRNAGAYPLRDDWASGPLQQRMSFRGKLFQMG